MQAALDAVSNLLSLGGPVVLILLALSVIALATSLLKVWQFYCLGKSRPELLHQALRHWRSGDCPGGMSIAGAAPGPLGQILNGAMHALNTGAGSGQVKEDAERLAVRSLNQMRAGLRVLEVIAQTAPLLGLFGTVLGMIEAFRQLQAAGNQVDPAILAGGIWVALLTTAAGLAVAMPVSIVLASFEARISRESGLMDDVLTALFTGAPAEPAARTVEDGATLGAAGYAHT